MNNLRAGEVNGVLNIHSRSKDRRAKILSPLWNRPFEFEGQMFASFEGFFGGIKFPEDDPRRKYAFFSSLGEAQRCGNKASKEWAWWNGAKMALGSSEYLALVKAAHRASVLTSEDRKEALLATNNLLLKHEVETGANPHYTPKMFCEDLMELRAELLNQ